MKRFLLIITIIICYNFTNAQNPFEKYGYTPKIATLSNGKYNEFHDLDTIVQIGTVLFNTQTKQIVAFLQIDTLYSEATLQPDIVSMWMSPDPLSDERPSFSPYNFCRNNPIVFVDPDGRLDDWFENEKTGQIMNVKGTSQLPANEQNKGWVNIGKDDMFGGEHVPMGPLGAVTKLGDNSSSFMNEHGYDLKPKEETLIQKVTSYYYTEADGGIREVSDPSVSVIKRETTKVTYVSKNNKMVNVQDKHLSTLKVEGGVPTKTETNKVQRNYKYGQQQQNNKDHSKTIEFGSKVLQFIIENVMK